MNAKARTAWHTIRGCVNAKRYMVTTYFVERMHQRGFFWPDVLSVLDEPTGVHDDGRDEWDRPKWIVAGKGVDELPVELVCALDSDDRGRVTVFITIY